MAIFTSSDAKVVMPRNIADGMIAKTQSTSVIAKLAAQQPMRFGETDYITFSDFPRAEFVEEGADKASVKSTLGVVTAKPRKAQVTMRFSEEVQWADEDYQLGILNTLAGAGATALSRALDLGLIHRINPLNGTAITGWDNYLASTTLRAEIGSTPVDDVFRNAVGLLVGAGEQVTGAAFDPKFTWALSSLKDGDGRQMFPQLGFGTGTEDFLGLPVAQGNTVSGVPEATDTRARAIVGDFTNGLRWGIQKDIPVELIHFGDPDGQGDLKRKNQIALRLELVYGWYVFPERFAIVEEAETEAGE